MLQPVVYSTSFHRNTPSACIKTDDSKETNTFRSFSCLCKITRQTDAVKLNEAS